MNRRWLVPAFLIAAAGCSGGGRAPSAPSTTTSASSSSTASTSSATPLDRTPTSISIVGVLPTTIGTSSQLSAVATFATGAPDTITTLASWGSSNPSVVSVSSTGLATAKAAGTADITATYQGDAGSIHLIVVPQMFTVSGVITDGFSGGILPNITIDIVDGVAVKQTTHTGVDGGYSIGNVSGGNITVTASAVGYQTTTRGASLGASARVDIVLPRAAAMTPGTISFGGVGANGTPVSTYTEAGFLIVPTGASWVASSYGHPAPFIEFFANGGETAVGEVVLSAGGSPFVFTSVDIYSSTTPIPYTITGVRNRTTVYTFSGTVPNTFGNFATVSSANDTPVDTLIIDVTNAAAPCCRNPVGIDTIVVSK